MEYSIKVQALMGKEYTPRIDDAWNALAEQINTIREQRKNLELEEKFFLNKLVELSHNKISCNDKFCLQLVERAGTVQYKSIPELKNVDLDQYRGQPTTYWNLKAI